MRAVFIDKDLLYGGFEVHCDLEGQFQRRAVLAIFYGNDCLSSNAKGCSQAFLGNFSHGSEDFQIVFQLIILLAFFCNNSLGQY